jgi:hypothetical protein
MIFCKVAPSVCQVSLSRPEQPPFSLPEALASPTVDECHSRGFRTDGAKILPKRLSGHFSGFDSEDFVDFSTTGIEGYGLFSKSQKSSPLARAESFRLIWFCSFFLQGHTWKAALSKRAGRRCPALFFDRNMTPTDIQRRTTQALPTIRRQSSGSLPYHS